MNMWVLQVSLCDQVRHAITMFDVYQVCSWNDCMSLYGLFYAPCNLIYTKNILQEWKDERLHWEPKFYGDVEKLYVPSDAIWIPDIVLYNK